MKTTPQKGQTVIWDGHPHEIIDVAGDVVEFSAGSCSRSVAIAGLDLLEDGSWGVHGRTEKRPDRAAPGVQVQPATKEG